MKSHEIEVNVCYQIRRNGKVIKEVNNAKSKEGNCEIQKTNKQ